MTSDCRGQSLKWRFLGNPTIAPTLNQLLDSFLIPRTAGTKFLGRVERGRSTARATSAYGIGECQTIAPSSRGRVRFYDAVHGKRDALALARERTRGAFLVEVGLEEFLSCRPPSP